MLNGNVGVMKSMMAELTDETNMARGFSLISVTWAVGATLGYSISPLFFVLWLISDPLVPSLVECYRDHKIIGPMCSRILSGANTHTSCHVLPPRRILSYRFVLLRSS